MFEVGSPMRMPLLGTACEFHQLPITHVSIQTSDPSTNTEAISSATGTTAVIQLKSLHDVHPQVVRSLPKRELQHLSPNSATLTPAISPPAQLCPLARPRLFLPRTSATTLISLLRLP